MDKKITKENVLVLVPFIEHADKRDLEGSLIDMFEKDASILIGVALHQRAKASGKELEIPGELGLIVMMVSMIVEPDSIDDAVTAACRKILVVDALKKGDEEFIKLFGQIEITGDEHKKIFSA